MGLGVRASGFMGRRGEAVGPEGHGSRPDTRASLVWHGFGLVRCGGNCWSYLLRFALALRQGAGGPG